MAPLDPGAQLGPSSRHHRAGNEPPQYQRPFAKPPKATRPIRTMIRPSRMLHTSITTIPTITRIPPREIPPMPPRRSGVDIGSASSLPSDPPVPLVERSETPAPRLLRQPHGFEGRLGITVADDAP